MRDLLEIPGPSTFAQNLLHRAAPRKPQALSNRTGAHARDVPMAHPKLEVILILQRIAVEIPLPRMVVYAGHRNVESGIGDLLLTNEGDHRNALLIDDVVSDVGALERIPRPRRMGRGDDLVAFDRVRIQMPGCAIVADVDAVGAARASHEDGSDSECAQDSETGPATSGHAGRDPRTLGMPRTRLCHGGRGR